MLRRMGTAWRDLRRNEDGNIAILFGASAIPLLLIMGGALDLARYNRYKAELSNAVDAAGIALAREATVYDDDCPDVGDTCADAAEFVTDYVDMFGITDPRLEVSTISVVKSANGFEILADGSMETMFLPLGNLSGVGGRITDLNLDVNAGVVTASNRLELALVLDNTGSMNCSGTVTYDCAELWSAPQANSRFSAVKTAAKSLVNTLMTAELTDPNFVKIALVPFEGMVNVASTGFSTTNPPNWIDWSNDTGAKYNGVNFDQLNSKNVGHKALYAKLTANNASIKWAGCVEMREGNYELTDTAPDPAVKNSLFVPFFWPDEPDTNSSPSGSSNNENGNTYNNNYLRDQQNFTTSGNEDPAKAQKSLKKYNMLPSPNNVTITWTSTTIRDQAIATATTPYRYGPNKGCPKPIVPLTNATSKTTILNAIDAMIAYWATGTYIPTGLVWGWHVLSSGEPYTQGIAPGAEHFDDTVKAIVLLTDGENDVAPGGTKVNYYTVNQNNNGSRYSAYSYLNTIVGGQRRLASTNAAAETALNTKMTTLCTNVKNGSIRLYTITFGTISQETKNLLQSCATLDDGQRLYYHAPSNDDLQDIFDEIGEDLAKLHLSS